MSSAEAEQFKNQGNAALNRGDFPEAIKAYTEAIRLDPSNHIYYSNRAAAYTSCSLIEQAIADAKKTIELQPKWAKGYSRLGAAYARQGDIEGAQKAYEDGLTHCPDDTSLKQGIAHLEGMMQQQQQQIFGQMFHNLRERLSKDPRTSALLSQPDFSAMVDDLIANPGNVMRHQSNPNFNLLLQVALSNVIPPGGRGAGPTPTPAQHTEPTSAAAAASPPPAAAAASSSATPADSKMDVEKEPEPQEHEEEEEIDPEEQERREKKKLAVAAKEEGNALYKAHKFDEAIAAYNRAIELDPSEMSFITNRAAVNFQTGKYEECIKDCEEAILVGREHRASFGLIAKALVRIGNAYYKLGNLEGALDAYRRSQTEERSRETAKLINKVEQEKARRDEQAYLNPELSLAAKERGNAFFKEGKYPQAVSEYTEAIKRNPTDPVLYSNRAITYQKLWEFPKALEDCDKALELDPKFARAYARKGQTLTIQQEYAKALDVFRAGLAIEPENAELKAGLQRVLMLINQQHASGQVDPERAKRAMADPEIQAILKDPEVSIVLQRAQTDPQALQRAMADEKIRHKIEKLVASGIL